MNDAGFTAVSSSTVVSARQAHTHLSKFQTFIANDLNSSLRSFISLSPCPTLRRLSCSISKASSSETLNCAAFSGPINGCTPVLSESFFNLSSILLLNCLPRTRCPFTFHSVAAGSVLYSRVYSDFIVCFFGDTLITKINLVGAVL